MTIPEGQSEVLFPLNANNNPGYGKWPMAVMGKATVDGAQFGFPRNWRRSKLRRHTCS